MKTLQPIFQFVWSAHKIMFSLKIKDRERKLAVYTMRSITELFVCVCSTRSRHYSFVLLLYHMNEYGTASLID